MDLMPFGKHKNKPIKEVPTSYLLWLVRETKWGELVDALHAELVNREVKVKKPPPKKMKIPKKKVPGISYLQLPYPAKHSIPADVVLNPSEECPFGDEDVSELDREYLEIVSESR